MVAEELSVLLHTTLNPYKQNQMVKCPMHDDRTASLSISIPKGVWYCWGCGKGGNLTTLARFLGGDLDPADVLVATVDLEPEPEPVDFTSKYDKWLPITPLTPEALEYRKRRGISYEALEYFGTRHDNWGTLCFPYLDGNRVVALRYRGITAKYFETGSVRSIYNLNAVRGASHIILAEGESDTQALWTALHGTSRYTVGGVPGANSSIERWELWALDMMWAESVYIAFDADEAGDKGAERAIEVLSRTIPKVERLRPTAGNDWAEALLAGEKPSERLPS